MRFIPAVFAVSIAALVASAASADTAEWAIDGSHSHVGFTISHLVVSSVNGRFKDVSGKVLLDEADLTKSQVDSGVDETNYEKVLEERGQTA